MAKDDIRGQIQEYKDKGVVVYSISRLNSYNTCQYGYHLTYNKKLPQVDNPYSILGGVIHDCIENVYLEEGTQEDMIKTINDEFMKCEILGINFPSELIKNNWKADIDHFMDNFNRIDGKFITEKGFIADIDGIKIQGFIDAITTEGDNLKILDWKTSAQFKDKKLLESGRQLLLYKYAMEQLSSFKVDKIGWFMLKYVDVKYGNRTKMCSRRKWVKDISNLLKTDLKRCGVDEFIAQIMLEKAIEDNSLKGLPEEIQNKYIVEDCTVYYDYNDELMDECKQYIINTVKDIESKDKESDEDFIPTTIDKKSEFFCYQLCGQRENCKYFQEYKQKAVAN